mmetsp:Transcript_153323/g.267987  ORF Transcript_153323/g.267987 Transcript_153323/m.267987 type:complete len:665 (-) Transcript_153323:526-2520(-)
MGTCCTCALVTDILDEKSNAAKTSMLESPRQQTTDQATFNTPSMSRHMSFDPKAHLGVNFGGDPVDTDPQDYTYEHITDVDVDTDAMADGWVHPKDVYALKAFSPRALAPLDCNVTAGHAPNTLTQLTLCTDETLPLSTRSANLSLVDLGSGSVAQKYKHVSNANKLHQLHTEFSPRKSSRSEVSSPRSSRTWSTHRTSQLRQFPGLGSPTPNHSPQLTRAPAAATKGSTLALGRVTKQERANNATQINLSMVNEPNQTQRNQANHQGRRAFSTAKRRPASLSPSPKAHFPTFSDRASAGRRVDLEAGCQMPTFPVFKGSPSGDTGTTNQTRFVADGSRRLLEEPAVPPSSPNLSKVSPNTRGRHLASWSGECQVRHVGLQTSRPVEKLPSVLEFPTYSPTQGPRARAWWGAFECSQPTMVRRGPSICMEHKGIQVDLTDHHCKVSARCAYTKESCSPETRTATANRRATRGKPKRLYHERSRSSSVSESLSPGHEEVFIDFDGVDMMTESLDVLLFNYGTEGTPLHEQVLTPSVTNNYASPSLWSVAGGDLLTVDKTQGSRRPSQSLTMRSSRRRSSTWAGLPIVYMDQGSCSVNVPNDVELYMDSIRLPTRVNLDGHQVVPACHPSPSQDKWCARGLHVHSSNSPAPSNNPSPGLCRRISMP